MALRRELEAGGGRFLSDHSDTEVIRQAHLTWGIYGMHRRLSGMWAFASGLPISFGGIGVNEATLVLFLGFGGVPSGDVLLVALVVRASSILVSLVGLPSAMRLWKERATPAT